MYERIIHMHSLVKKYKVLIRRDQTISNKVKQSLNTNK